MAGEHLSSPGQIAEALRRNPQVSFMQTVDFDPGNGRASATMRDLAHPEFDYIKKGHFGILPGVLGAQTMADLSVLLAERHPAMTGRVAVLSEVETAKFSGMVTPGVQANLALEVKDIGAETMKTQGTITFDNGEKIVRAATATLNFDLLSEEDWRFGLERGFAAPPTLERGDFDGMPTLMTHQQAEKIVPHSDPFFLVDRIVTHQPEMIEALPVRFADPMYSFADSRPYGDPFVLKLLFWEAVNQSGAVLALADKPGSPILLREMTRVGGVEVTYGESLLMQMKLDGKLEESRIGLRGAGFGSVVRQVANQTLAVMTGEASFLIPPKPEAT